VQYLESENRYRTGAHYLYYSFEALSYLRKGTRDILPRLGLSTTAGYYHAPFDNQVYGAVARGATTIYLPGLWKHQTMKFSVNYQRQFPLDMSHPAFINLMPLPRGIHGVFGEVLTKYSGDYVFPLLYPDLEITSLLYIKRIRTALWADYMVGRNVVIREPHPHYEDKEYATVGVDLVLDLNLLRISFPVSIGGRMIYEPVTGALGFEWIYEIEIN
jgi:hypothetical protein